MADGDGPERPAKAGSLEQEFHDAMVEIYRNAKRQASYNAAYFIQMVSHKGGLESARGLLLATKPSDGFTALWERGRLDLTVEALVLEPKFESLFTEEEREIAYNRLLEYGYTPRGGDTTQTHHVGDDAEPETRSQEPPPTARPRTDPAADFHSPRERQVGERAAAEADASATRSGLGKSGRSGPGGGSINWDFFVSYTQADLNWAEWIAWHLEDVGYQVLFQAWDFVPGSHWTERMGEGIRDAERTLAVLSHAYLESVYGAAEWHAAYRNDPRGFARKLIPVRVEDCPRPGLLGEVVSFDLFGLAPDAARDQLVRQIGVALAGRAKPSSAPGFPRQPDPLQKSSKSHTEPPAPEREHPGHSGKYRALWAWLRNQDADRLPMTFSEIENIIGLPLPPSARKHPAHWSGYDGSAVARAIRDAGWTARQVDVVHGRLVFVRAR